jgi:alkylation response protein AidB-like acyl-CoA dehydrogenase
MTAPSGSCRAAYHRRVDFELSEDQEELRKAAADLLDAMATPARVRQVAEDGDHVDRRLWRSMAEQGWMAVELSTEAGGLGLGAVEVSVLGEQLGRHVAPVPFLGTVLAAGALVRGLGSGAAGPGVSLGGSSLSAWVERLATGAAVGAVAWPARPGSFCAAWRGGGWRLSGGGDPVVYAPAADVVVVPAATPEGRGLFVLAPAARPAAEPAMDRTRCLGRLEASDEPAVCLGGDEAVETLLDRALAGLCAEMLGAAERVLEMSVEYAKVRVQFGRPIGSFQAVKHRCADMLVDVEGMRSAAYYAAWAVGAGDPEASAASSAAKVWCSEASRRVMGSALQVHGGIGFTWEHDLHLYVKRAQLDQISYGDADAHRDRLARILRPRAEAGQPVL